MLEDGCRRLLLISLQDAVVALPADALVEILPARPYAQIPGAAPAVAGLVNRRGRILTVVDVGVALHCASTATGADHRIVVVAYRGRELGLAVKDVLQITSDWWTEADPGEEEARLPATAPAESQTRPDAAGDEQLRVVELDTMLAPLFGHQGQAAGESTSEKS